jgi:hypothetical protein
VIKYEDFVQDNPFICDESESRSAKKDRRRKRAFEKALILEKHDLSQYANRHDAEIGLKAQADEMVAGAGGIFFSVFSAVLLWIIRKLLDNYFGVK